MRCADCQQDNPSQARFCDRCGAGLVARCAECGAAGRAGARFCGQCGARFSAGAPVPIAPATDSPPEGERKQLTVLFADICGSTALIDALDPEAAQARLEPALAAMMRAVRRFGGTVTRSTGDGIMALFGAPLAVENHAVRACLAARAMLDDTVGREAAIRIGLNSGEVVTRQTGPGAADLEADGVAVHLARRVEEMAEPDTCCLAARTAMLARGYVELERLGFRTLRGISEPVDVSVLLSATDRPSWEVRSAAMSGFVGREAELATLAAARDRAAAGRGQAVTIVGDAGLGKSRLAHEFLDDAGTAGWMVLRGSGVGHAEGMPYRLAATLLRDWLGVSDADDRAEITRRLAEARARLRLGTADAAPLESLLDLPVGDPEWAALDPAMRRARLAAAWRLALLRLSAAAPLLLLIEDLHWADVPSRQLIEDLVDGLGGARLLVLVTTRPDRMPAWTEGHARSFSTLLPLGPLPAVASEALLAEKLPGPALAALRSRILARAEGTPLFLEELARALVEQGVVVPADIVTTRVEPRTAGNVADIVIPWSVQAILASRIDRLPTARRRVLQVASVIGKYFSAALLAALANVPEPALQEDLQALQAAEFVYEMHQPAELGSSGAHYTFKHALTHAVTYDGMLLRQRRELHARVLAALEAGAQDRAEELTEQLADHAVRGEVWDRVVLYAGQAGRRANARSAYSEAAAFFQTALEALARLPQTPALLAQGIELRLDLRVALAPAGRYRRIIEILDEARGLAEQLTDEPRLARIAIGRCTVLTNLGRLDEAVEAGRQGQASAARRDDAALLVNAGFALGQAHWFRGDLADAAEVLGAALHHVRGRMRLHNTGTTGTGSVLHLVCLSKTLALTGQFAAASDIAAEVQAIAEETRKPYDLSYAELAGGFTHFIAKENEVAIGRLEAALAHARRGEIALLVPSVARYLGRAYARAGRLEEAHALLDEAIATTEAHGLVGLRASCGAALGAAHAARGAEGAAQATAAFDHALDLARRYGYRPVAAHVLRRLGVLRTEQADVSGITLLEQAAALAELLGMRPELATIRSDLAAAMRRAGRDGAQAAEAASRALHEALGSRPDPKMT